MAPHVSNMLMTFLFMVLSSLSFCTTNSFMRLSAFNWLNLAPRQTFWYLLGVIDSKVKCSVLLSKILFFALNEWMFSFQFLGRVVPLF